jgi:hypothetical protein
VRLGRLEGERRGGGRGQGFDADLEHDTDLGEGLGCWESGLGNFVH